MDANADVPFDYSKYVSTMCAPIFIEEKLYNETVHNEETPSATATFIKFNNSLYIVTCKHVVDIYAEKVDNSNKNFTMRMNFGNIDIDLSSSVENSKKDVLSCPTFYIVDGKDIAIAKIDFDLFKKVASEKNKKYIDFDDPNYTEHLPKENSLVCAYGWLCDTKYNKNNNLITQMASIVIELTAICNDEDGNLTLCSNMERVPPPLSGMSGGPIFCEVDGNVISPLGIIYEGIPGGSSKEGNGESIFPKTTVIIKGYQLTRMFFKQWLECIKPVWQTHSIYKKYRPLPDAIVEGTEPPQWKEGHSFSIVGHLRR